MKSLCTCAALAVATAFAHGHFADALLRSNAMQRNEEKIADENLKSDLVNCLEKIKEFRNSLLGGAEEYVTIGGVDAGEDTRDDLSAFLKQQTCEGLKNGKFNHIADVSEQKIFVITAKKSAAREGEACDSALTQWKSGFSAFNGEYPPKYTDVSSVEKNANPYENPDAAALVSLLHKDAQHVICGTLEACTSEIELLCYFKPSGITTGNYPVDPHLWHAFEAQQKLKPTLVKKEETKDGDSLKAVNEARTAAGLKDNFTNPIPSTALSRRRVKRSDTSEKIEEAVQKVLYSLTCEDISKSRISPAPSTEDFTVIYYIKDKTDATVNSGSTAPTIEEAVKYWQSGFDKLKYKRPPVFKKDSIKLPEDDGAVAADDTPMVGPEIYEDSAVAGYASIMADGPHSMACFEAKGCEDEKTALICVLHTATLVEGKQPISKATWAGIMKSKGYPLPTFSQLEASKNCLEEMNAVRTQEKLGLKPFLVKTETTKSGTELVLSDLMESVTCQAIGGTTAKTAETAGPEFKITDGATSLMYHTGTENTCSEAVEAWKKGSEKFSAAPPAYTAQENVYKDSAATNFVSLISDGEKTATCYSTGCEKNGIVCELSPAALVDGQKPVSEDTWTKYNESAESSGVAGFSKAALVGTVGMMLAAGVFFL